MRIARTIVLSTIAAWRLTSDGERGLSRILVTSPTALPIVSEGLLRPALRRRHA